MGGVGVYVSAKNRYLMWHLLAAIYLCRKCGVKMAFDRINEISHLKITLIFACVCTLLHSCWGMKCKKILNNYGIIKVEKYELLLVSTFMVFLFTLSKISSPFLLSTRKVCSIKQYHVINSFMAAILRAQKTPFLFYTLHPYIHPLLDLCLVIS
jgi:hypothetical protein